MNGPTVNGLHGDGGPNNRIDVIDTAGGRILCVADIRGKLSALNEYAAQHQAKVVIATGDVGFFDKSSLSRISERTLRHLVQYSNLLSTASRQAILGATNLEAMRQAVLDASKNGFALSEFPKLVTGELKLAVPVYTVYGACEDVAILERLRAEPAGPINVGTHPFQPQQTGGPSSQASFSIPNLTVLSEGVTRALMIGGVRLRLFGLGGALVPHKFFDNGEGQATIAGASGTMWTTILQIGELVDTAQRVYDQAETRLLITHASPGREGLLAQLALVLKADLTISAGLHFRYGVSYNEYSVQHDADAYRNKLLASKMAFNEVWDTVKTQVEQVIDDQQRKFLDNALAVANRLPADAPAGQPAGEEPAWKNSWNWNLPDANYGSLVLDVREGRFSAEMRSQGFNFAYRQQSAPAQRGPAVKVPQSQQPPQQQQSLPSGPSAALSTSAKPTPPPGPAVERSGAPPHKEGEDRPPHLHHENSDRGRGRGRGFGRGGGGPGRGGFRDGPPRDAATPEASDAPAAQAGPKPEGAEEGGQNKFGGGFERGRGRGRGRGEGRGEFRGARGGGFRGRGGQHGGSGPAGQGNAGTSESSAPASTSAPAPAAAANGSGGKDEPAW